MLKNVRIYCNCSFVCSLYTRKLDFLKNNQDLTNEIDVISYRKKIIQLANLQSTNTFTDNASHSWVGGRLVLSRVNFIVSYRIPLHAPQFFHTAENLTQNVKYNPAFWLNIIVFIFYYTFVLYMEGISKYPDDSR